MEWGNVLVGTVPHSTAMAVRVDEGLRIGALRELLQRCGGSGRDAHFLDRN